MDGKWILWKGGIKHKAKKPWEDCFVWNVFSSSRGNLPTWNPLIRLPKCQGKALLHPGPQAPPSVHMVLLLVMPGCEGLSHMHYFKSNIGIWKLTYFESHLPILLKTLKWTILRCLKTWVVAIVFKMVGKKVCNGDVIKTNYEYLINVHIVFMYWTCVLIDVPWLSSVGWLRNPGVAFALSMCKLEWVLSPLLLQKKFNGHLLEVKIGFILLYNLLM